MPFMAITASGASRCIGKLGAAPAAAEFTIPQLCLRGQVSKMVFSFKESQDSGKSSN